MPMWRNGRAMANACRVASLSGWAPQASGPRAQGSGLRENSRARSSASATTFTTLGLSQSAALCTGCTAVAMGQSGSAARVVASASMRVGGISGSSPCTLTTTVSCASSISVMASASRSVPEAWSARVMITSCPCSRATAATSSLSVAMATRSAFDRRA